MFLVRRVAASASPRWVCDTQYYAWCRLLPQFSRGHCHCGDADTAPPELDVRLIPHSVRHGAVLGAFDAVPSGGSLVLVAPHDPLPLLRQLDERAGGRLSVEYLQRGPDAWRLKLTR